VEVGGVELGRAAIGIAGGRRMPIGEICVAHAVVDVRRSWISGDVLAESSYRVLEARLIEQ
jgi:hypothetical protein